MNRPSGPASEARFVAGALAALWGMLGLTLAYTFASLYGVKAAIAAAVLFNIALVSAAALAFVNAPRWRAAMILSVVLVTLDRMFNMIFTGANAWGVIIDLAAFLAIAAIAILSPGPRTRVL